MTTSTNGIEKPGTMAGNPDRVLLDCAPVGVIAVDGASRVTAINSHALNLLNLSAASIAGEPASRLPAAIAKWVEEAFERHDHNESMFPVSDTKYLAQVTTDRCGEGRITGVLLEFQDRTVAQSISDNLDHLDQLAGLGTVTAGVAHEIKNALVAVRTFFDLAGLGENDLELRNVAASEVLRIEKTVRQILRGAKREQFRLAPLSVHALVQDAVNLVRYELQTREIQLTTKFAAPIDRINGDERQLRHALVNILLNGIEAMGSSGELTIASEVVEAWERQHLRVSITDSGPGISPEALNQLFNPFFTTKPEGTGLGLPISLRIIKTHNGTITAESEHGNGATFHLFLPLL